MEVKVVSTSFINFINKDNKKNIEDKDINYKNVAFLKNFVSDLGFILPRFTNGCTAKQQRRIASAIKLAKYMGLMSYLNR